MPTCSTQDCCCRRPCPRSRPLPVQISAGELQTPTGRSGSVSWGVTAPFPWVLVHTRFCLCLSKVSTSPSPVEVLESNPIDLQIQIPWRFPVPLLDPQVGKSHVGPRTFAALRELLWYFCSPVCRSPTWWVWDFILSWLCPSYSLIVVSPLSLDTGYFFWWVPTSSYQWVFNS